MAAQSPRSPADWESMGRRTAFADVLDEKLGAENAPRPAAAPTYAHRATVHTFYEFAAATKPVAGWHPRHPYVTTAAPTGRSANETARTTRRLSAEEGAALEQLNALGARVR